jgi:hypothetical protein
MYGNKNAKLGTALCVCNATWDAEMENWEDWESRASLGYIVRSLFQKQKKYLRCLLYYYISIL